MIKELKSKQNELQIEIDSLKYRLNQQDKLIEKLREDFEQLATEKWNETKMLKDMFESKLEEYWKKIKELELLILGVETEYKIFKLEREKRLCEMDT